MLGSYFSRVHLPLLQSVGSVGVLLLACCKMKIYLAAQYFHYREYGKASQPGGVGRKREEIWEAAVQCALCLSSTFCAPRMFRHLIHNSYTQ